MDTPRNRDKFAEITVKFADGGEYVNVGTYTSVLSNALSIGDSTSIVTFITIVEITEKQYEKRLKELVEAQFTRTVVNPRNKDKS